MHWVGLVIIPPETIDIEKQVAEMLGPFKFNDDVEPYKQYFGPRAIAFWKQQWSTDDMTVIAEHLKETGWGKMGNAGLDERGLYHITTNQPLGEWDNWCFSGGEWILGEDQWKKCLELHHPSIGRDEPVTCNMCRVSDLPKGLVMYSIVTPDGKWHDRDMYAEDYVVGYWQAWRELTAQESENWDKRFKQLLSLYPDHVAVGVDFHG